MKSISDGPTYECTVCNRFMYRTSVKYVTDKLINQSSFLLNHHIGKWICVTCANFIKRRKLPPQSAKNNMKVNAVPEPLTDLCSPEKQLISKNFPFMKILSVPKGSQQSLRGQVVLVPSNVQLTASSLPRNTSDAQIIALNLKSF